MLNSDDFLARHEKFLAFILLGAALFTLAVMVYIKPPSSIESNGAALAILNTIVGALTLAFGGAANALFKIITDSEKKSIGQAAADAVANSGPMSGPMQTEVNTQAEPVLVKAPTDADVPPMFKEQDNG